MPNARGIYPCRLSLETPKFKAHPLPNIVHFNELTICLQQGRNSPGVFRECFVQHSGCFFNLVVLLAECILLFVRGLVADHAMQSILVASMHPFHGFPFELAFGFPRAEMLDDLRLEQSDDGFGQCVVAAVSDASDGHVDSDFGEPLGLSNGHILHAAVRVAGKRAQRRSSLADGLVGDENKVGRH